MGHLGVGPTILGFLIFPLWLAAQFADPFLAKLEAHIGATATQRGWVAAPPELRGNFWSVAYCAPPETPTGCRTRVQTPGPHTLPFVELARVGVDPQHHPTGLTFRWSDRPIDQEGLSVWWSVGGGSVTGDAFSIDVYAGGATRPSYSYSLNPSWQLGVEQVSVPLLPNLGPRESVKALCADLARLPEHLLSASHRLQTEVDRRLDAGYLVCRYGPYEGGGLPPECTLSPATPVEISEERSRFNNTHQSSTAWIRSGTGKLQQTIADWISPGLP